MLVRMLRAGARRLASADPADFAAMVALSAELDLAMSRAVAGMRATGFSWAEIAEPLGITRQAAQKRWARKVAELNGEATQ